MSKYVIMHGQFHEMSDDELMHWKYIKREKVNGKWVYTYKQPESNQPTTRYDMAKANQKRKKDAEKAARKEERTNKLTNCRNAGKEKIEQNRAERKKDWEESKVRGTEKAAKEATKYDGGIVIKNDEYGARKIKSTFKDFYSSD